MRLPVEAATALREFRSRLVSFGDVTALYAGGSLASGDYCPGVSDLDLVAIVPQRLAPARERELERLHRGLVAEVPEGARLQCVYVPAPDLADVARAHPTWANGELYPRTLSGIARAELLRFGLVLDGPPVADVMPAAGPGDLRDAVREELGGYWTTALGRRRAWLKDVYVDLGLTVVIRADATLTEDRLITKREALTRLDAFGVPDWLADEIRRRRAGETVHLTLVRRLRRARLTRRLVAEGIDTVLAR